MATMGLRINNGSSGIDTSTAKIFADALFGNPDQEMKFARLQSDLATDEYTRAQIKSHEDYNRALEALKKQEFEGKEAFVAPAGKLAHDFTLSTQGGGGAVTEAPVPVDVPIPVARPADQIISAFPARPGYVSDNDPVPVEPQDIVQQVISQFPSRPGIETTPTSAYPARPAPELSQSEILTESPAGVGPFPGRPAGPELAQRPMPGPFPARPGVDVGAPVGPFPGRPGAPGDNGMGLPGISPYGDPDISPATSEDFITFSDVMNYLWPGAAAGQAAAPPAPVDIGPTIETPETLPAYTPVSGQAPADLPVPVLQPPVSQVPETPEALSAYHPLQADPSMFTGGVPEPVAVEPGMVGGAETPPPVGEMALQPGPFPPRPEGYAPPAGPEEPVPVEPLAIPGEPVLPEPTPEDVAAVAEHVQQQVGPVALTEDEWRGLARGALTTNDPAGTLNKLMGTAGLTYGDRNNGDKMRIAMAMMTGQTPTTTSVAVSADTAGVNAAAAKDIAVNAADPAKLKERTTTIDGVLYNLKEDPVTKEVVATKAPGSPAAKPQIQVVKDVPYQVTTDANNNAVLTLPKGFDPATAKPDDLGGSDNEQMRVIRDAALAVSDPSKVITPEQAVSYGLIHGKMSIPHYDTRTVEGPNGPELGRIMVPGQDMSAYPSVADVYQRAGLPPPAAPAPAVATSEAAAAAETPPDPAAVAAADAVTGGEGQPPKVIYDGQVQPVVPNRAPQTKNGPAVGTVNGKTYGTGGWEVIVPGAGKKRTEFQDRASLWLREAVAADNDLKTMKPPSWYEKWAMQLGSGPEGMDMVDAYLQEHVPSQEAMRFTSAAASFINSEGRINSGASIQNREDVALGFRFTPRGTDDATTLEYKAGQRKIALDGIYDVLANNNLLTPELQAELEGMGYTREARKSPGDTDTTTGTTKAPAIKDAKPGDIIDYDPSPGMHGS